MANIPTNITIRALKRLRMSSESYPVGPGSLADGVARVTNDAIVTVTGPALALKGVGRINAQSRRGLVELLVEDSVVGLLGRLGMTTSLPTSKPLSTVEGFACGGVAGCIAVR